MLKRLFKPSAIHIYENTKAAFIMLDSETDSCNISYAVFQVENLAPFFFITVLDYVMRKVISGNKGKQGFAKFYKKVEKKHKLS